MDVVHWCKIVNCWSVGTVLVTEFQYFHYFFTMKVQWNKIQIHVNGKQFDKENPTEFYTHCDVYKICFKKITLKQMNITAHHQLELYVLHVVIFFLKEWLEALFNKIKNPLK